MKYRTPSKEQLDKAIEMMKLTRKERDAINKRAGSVASHTIAYASPEKERNESVIIQAIRKAGLNRVLIRDVLTDLKTFQGYKGITGKIILDGSWNDIGDIWMAEVKDGKFNYSISPSRLSKMNGSNNAKK